MEMGDEAGEKGMACSGEALVRSLDISGQVEDLRCRFLYPNGLDINWMDGNRADRVRFDPSIISLVVF
jgi:hypothetical protein